MEKSRHENLIVMWLMWHFYEMPKFLFSIWKNYTLFLLDFFSAPILLKTLFSPWRKYKWSYPKSFSIMEYLNTFISNFFSRIIGVMCRLALVILSFLAQIVAFFLGSCIMVGWILLPLILLVLLVLSFSPWINSISLS